MKEFTVTLKLRLLDEESGQSRPSTWNWAELLDLHPDEEVGVTVDEEVSGRRVED